MMRSRTGVRNSQVSNGIRESETDSDVKDESVLDKGFSESSSDPTSAAAFAFQSP